MVELSLDINLDIVSKLIATKEALTGNLRHRLRHSVEAIKYSFATDAKHGHYVYAVSNDYSKLKCKVKGDKPELTLESISLSIKNDGLSGGVIDGKKNKTTTIVSLLAEEVNTEELTKLNK